MCTCDGGLSTNAFLRLAGAISGMVAIDPWDRQRTPLLQIGNIYLLVVTVPAFATELVGGAGAQAGARC